MTTGLPDGTWIVMAVGGLGRIVRTTRRNGAPGYDVADGGPYTRFMPDWCAHPAIIGDTVCALPYGHHWCGRAHVTEQELTRLPRKEDTTG